MHIRQYFKKRMRGTPSPAVRSRKKLWSSRTYDSNARSYFSTTFNIIYVEFHLVGTSKHN
ncbi:hypothetical protein V6Z11_A02G143800 [Gossypium hirsutum]